MPTIHFPNFIYIHIVKKIMDIIFQNFNDS